MNFFYAILFISCFSGLVLGDDETPKTVTISNNLWFGNLVGRFYNMSLTVPENSTYFEVMQIAAQKNKHFVFKAIKTDLGHYITSIDNFDEIPKLKYHWMIYKLPEVPDINNKPGDEFLSDVGVDLIKVHDGDVYLFWYKQVKY